MSLWQRDRQELHDALVTIDVQASLLLRYLIHFANWEFTDEPDPLLGLTVGDLASFQSITELAEAIIETLDKVDAHHK